MSPKNTILSILAATALVIAPLAPAHADGWHHHHDGDGLLFGLLGVGAAVTVAAATIATAPFRIIADASQPAPVNGYYAAPTYYAPQPPPQMYAYPTGYSYYGDRERPRVVYAYPQPVYSYPAPVYYYGQ